MTLRGAVHVEPVKSRTCAQSGLANQLVGRAQVLVDGGCDVSDVLDGDQCSECSSVEDLGRPAVQSAATRDEFLRLVQGLHDTGGPWAIGIVALIRRRRL